MVVGFVLIVTETSKEHEVYKHLAGVKEVLETHPLFGEYDILAKVEADSMEEIGRIVVNVIRAVDGVNDTKTLTGIKL